MNRPEEYGPNVRLSVREDWIILQQKKFGLWVDMRFYDIINDEFAVKDAREHAERLAAKCASLSHRDDGTHSRTVVSPNPL